MPPSATLPSPPPTTTPPPTPSTLSASRLTYTRTTTPRQPPLPGSPSVLTSSTCTDHMITCTWTLSSGWGPPELKPYGPFSIMPTASVLHYATECFEGLKAYRGYDGHLRLFRPSLNCTRMVRSASRIALPAFPPSELEKLILALLRVDGAKWLPPSRPGQFIYLRPSLIATHPALGVQRPQEAMLFIIACFLPDLCGPSAPLAAVGGPLKPPPQGLRLLASAEDTIRAWPGGFGHAKVGANYGPSLVAQGEARAKGYAQVLWLFGPEDHITEAGASNFFLVLETPGEGVEVVTAPLEGGIILDGITRRSVLELVRERMPGVRVSERWVGMGEVVERWGRGEVREAFVAGTAYFVAPVVEVGFRGVDLVMPAWGKRPPGEEGVGGRVRRWLGEIMYGVGEGVGCEWGVVVDGEEVVAGEGF